MFPSDVTKVLYFHKKNSSAVASTVSVTWSRDSSHESSVDLGINGDSRHSIPSEPPAEGSTLTAEDCAINSEFSRL